MTEKKKQQNAEKDTRKAVSEDVEKFFRDVWSKVVEYASLGAEEATKLSSSAKIRVDMETLKFKRGKVIKMLGERYLDLCENDPSVVLKGTKDILSDIQKLDKEINALEKEMARAKKGEKKRPAKPAAKKAAPKKAPARKKATAKKTTGTKKSAGTKTAERKKAAERVEGKE